LEKRVFYPEPSVSKLSHEKILSMDGKISSVDKIILSMDKSATCRKKMMDNLFIHGCYPWIESIDKDDR